MRRRWRAIILVTGMTLSVLLCVAFVISAWWQIAIHVPDGPSVGCVAGAIFVRISFPFRTGWETARHRYGLHRWATFRTYSGRWTRISPPASGVYREFIFPLWLPFLIIHVLLFPFWAGVFFKELALLDSGAQKAVFEVASRRAIYGRLFWTGVAVLIGLSFLVAWRLVDHSLAIGGLVVLFSFAVLQILVLGRRKAIVREIRVELNRRGLTVCAACGYNLTGNVSGRCPECGQAVG